jgi:decaprenylphospho-beta-D-ribofuranose 2-oxidase
VITDLAAFFHRLDALGGWNRTLGPRGFIEYRCVVPEGAHGVIRQILEAAQRHRCATFLGTLRRFGPESGLSARTCAVMYPWLAQWRAAASRLDPAGVFRSDLGQRLGLGRAGATSPGRKHAG